MVSLHLIAVPRCTKAVVCTTSIMLFLAGSLGPTQRLSDVGRPLPQAFLSVGTLQKPNTEHRFPKKFLDFDEQVQACTIDVSIPSTGASFPNTFEKPSPDPRQNPRIRKSPNAVRSDPSDICSQNCSHCYLSGLPRIPTHSGPGLHQQTPRAGPPGQSAEAINSACSDSNVAWSSPKLGVSLRFMEGQAGSAFGFFSHSSSLPWRREPCKAQSFPMWIFEQKLPPATPTSESIQRREIRQA